MAGLRLFIQLFLKVTREDRQCLLQPVEVLLGKVLKVGEQRLKYLRLMLCMVPAGNDANFCCVKIPLCAIDQLKKVIY